MAARIFLLCLLQLLAINVNAGFQDYHAAVIGRQNTASIPNECSYVVLILSACQILSPGFTALSPESKAPCLCYSDTAWAPQLFDGAIETCASWAQTADPVDYLGLVPYEGICTNVGDILSANNIVPGVGTTTPVPAPVPQPVTPSPTPTTSTPPIVVTTPPEPTPTPTQPPPVITPSPSSSDIGIRVNPACAIVGSALTFCESATPGFTSLLPQQMATCLCYSSTVWSPNGFDSPVSTCAEFVKTASPTDYPVLSGLEGFCTALGDVIKSGGSGAANTGKPLFNTDAPILDLNSRSMTPGTTPSVTTSRGTAAGTPRPTTITLIPTTTANSSSNIRKSALDGMAKTILLSSLAVVLGLLIIL
ncbi:hypothetical protein ONS95_004411 [Cadophora gregata]|uniref:uncharacterized protein n=1 Tax=Cadophora gregata TaxID=51156 RepID=UPI0026DC1744|nr:uncharacterized protein ONS95_004411 [Cadophora gregata]KAK0105194.1 hypothetical protein ONS96_004595 [Cadophora gregata f. sp. sojae]KAK0105898.1 hypothetical protein ONS95_004411 [Cadophora gregata]